MEGMKYLVNGHEVTLAKSTPRKLSKYLQIAGIGDLEKIGDELTRLQYGWQLFKIQLAEDTLKAMMENCLDNPPAIDWMDVDSRVIIQIMTDFFAQSLPSSAR